MQLRHVCISGVRGFRPLFICSSFPVQDPETRKQVEQYFKWEGADAQGRKFNQGKIFK
jgi:hypothetical protein